jgi:hypothetical protein
VSAARGGAAADISAYTVAQSAKVYHDGLTIANDGSQTTTGTFNSMKSALITGGTLHGISKTAYPYLQAINIDGSSITATNILDKVFDAFTTIRIKAKAGKMNKLVCSYKHLANVMKILESQKGAFKTTSTQTTISTYNWTEVAVVGVQGSFTIIGIQEMDDDVMMFLDMTAMTFRTNGFFKKRTSPDGRQFYEVRNTTGYQYIVDVCLHGDLEVTKPTACGIIYGISY